MNPLTIKTLLLGCTMLPVGMTCAAQDYGNNLGSLQMGTMKLTAYGEHPDLGFIMMGAKRQDNNKVTVTFQYGNQTGRDLRNVTLRATGYGAVEAIGADGTKYTVSGVTFGTESGQEVSAALPGGQAPVKVVVELANVPDEVSEIKNLIIPTTANYGEDPAVHSYTFVLDNVNILRPATMVVNPPAQTQQASTGDSGSRSAIVDGKATPGKSGAIFNPVANSLSTENDSWIINRNGVGPVKLGINVKAMPGRVDDLYNKVQWHNPQSGTLYIDGEEAIKLTVRNDVITGITIVGGKTHANVNGKMIYIGEKASALTSQKDVTTTGDTSLYKDITFKCADGTVRSMTITRE